MREGAVERVLGERLGSGSAVRKKKAEKGEREKRKPWAHNLAGSY